MNQSLSDGRTADLEPLQVDIRLCPENNNNMGNSTATPPTNLSDLSGDLPPSTSEVVPNAFTVLGLPKAEPRKGTGRKRGKSIIATSTPEMEARAKEADEKAKKLEEKALKAESRTSKRLEFDKGLAVKP